MDRRAFNASVLSAALLGPFAASAASKIKSDVSAVTGGGDAVTLPKAVVTDFQNSLRGQLLLPGFDSYEATRKVWNGMIDNHPGLIARCAGAADVINAVNFARDNSLLVSVRGGGHSISGKSVCEGGLMIDLAPMRWVRVNPENQTARLGPGSLLGDLDFESQAHGLATPAGTVSHTGAAGLTLGGGHGRLSRRFGLTADNVTSVDIVTADGRFLRANEYENQDLYWGVRGGGGNFGIVTSFEYQLHKVGPEVLNGLLMYPISQARDVLAFYSEFAAQAPRELSVDVIILAPPGRKAVLMLSSCFTGNFADAERALGPLRAFGKPLADQIGPKQYVDVQTSADASTPGGKQYYNKSGLMTELSADAIDAIVSRMEETSGQVDPGVATNVIIQHLGGAIADRAPGDTAYVHRDARHDVLLLSGWEDKSYSPQNIKWLRDAFATIQPYTNGFYSNHMVDSDEPQLNKTFRGNYDRLVQIKNRRDPENLFRLNANVKPTV
jgi:FAD/FMN-containing dehydrogenase